jgi:hypothetical protein
MSKFLRFSLFTLLTIFVINLNAQKRYLEPVFDKVKVTNPTGIATNYTVMTWIGALIAGNPNGHTARQPLVAQFYSPDGDTETKRPLIIYIHTGNFFPFPQNGSCGGTLRDSSNIDFATKLAKMGYVVAVVNYRQGWLPFVQQEPVRRFSLINAAYRGVQDISTYVRFFKKSVAELGNPYGIDPDKITLWGQGTGGYLSLASAYLNTYPEIFNTGDKDKFFLQTSATTKVPMVIEAYNGNIEGTSPITVVDTNYTKLTNLPVGDTLSTPNYPGFNSDFALCVNMGGALGDSAWMNKGEIPLISYHVKSDDFAPYFTDYLNVPTAGGPQRVVEVSGSGTLAIMADRFGNNDIFKTIPAGNDPIGDKKKSGFTGLCPFENTPNDSSSPWEWQKAGLPSPTPADCNTDALSSKMYIDSIIGYFAPRACVALNLPCQFKVSTKDLNDLDVDLALAPNPSSDVIRIETGKESPMTQITVFDITGRTLKMYKNLNVNYFELNKDQLQKGLYMLKLDFQKGSITKKIIFE